MFLHAIRTIAATAALVALSHAQTPQEAIPAFRGQTDLVVIPFQVRRGSGTTSDLKTADVVLLQDGVPRSFTVFEAPPVHLMLDLVVMFDVTNPTADQKGRAGFWDTKALQELAGYWTEASTRRLLDGQSAVIRVSIYRFDQFKLQRLCRSTSDPKVLREALHRLAQAPSQDPDIPLPAGLAARAAERNRLARGLPPQPWALAGALSTLRDSIAPSPSEDEATAARALVIFSTGAEGTAITPQVLADQAIAAGVPLYPVALFAGPVAVLPYDGEEHASINYQFEHLGDPTGGLHFEAVNHSPPPAESGQGVVPLTMVAFSMTGRETENILERVKRHAVVRFRSNYNVGFVPSPSGAPQEHKLEVKLASKSSGKLTEGKRSAIY